MRIVLWLLMIHTVSCGIYSPYRPTIAPRPIIFRTTTQPRRPTSTPYPSPLPSSTPVFPIQFKTTTESAVPTTTVPETTAVPTTTAPLLPIDPLQPFIGVLYNETRTLAAQLYGTAEGFNIVRGQIISQIAQWQLI